MFLFCIDILLLSLYHTMHIRAHTLCTCTLVFFWLFFCLYLYVWNICFHYRDSHRRPV